MAFLRDIEDALLTVLNNSLTIPVIPDYDGGPEPVGEYGVIGRPIAEKLHRNSVSSGKQGDDFVETIQQTFLLNFTFRFYGDNSDSNAFESQAILASTAVQEELYNNAALSYADITSVRPSPELRDTGYIQRALYDIKFLSGFEYTRTIDWFNTVSYSGEYVLPDGTLVLTESETVSASDT